jgi:hypothetical protein
VDGLKKYVINKMRNNGIEVSENDIESIRMATDPVSGDIKIFCSWKPEVFPVVEAGKFSWGKIVNLNSANQSEATL